MERIQERALRFIYDDFLTSYEELLVKSKLPSLKLRRIRTMALESFKIINKDCPVILHDLPYNGYFLRLEIFAIWTQKRSILIFAFLIFAIPFNRKKIIIDHYFHT